MLHYLLYYPLRLLMHLYFGKMTAFGTGVLKADRPRLFAANHPNSLLDALALSVLIRQPVYFLVPGGMMRHPVARFFLTLLHALPIYPPESGRQALLKNKATFERCRDLLMEHKPIIMFCEAWSRHPTQAPPVSKGIAKIAFSAEEIFDFKLDVQVIPLRLHYADPQRFRTRLAVWFGQPLRVRHFEQIYKDYPARAVRQLTAHIREGFSALFPAATAAAPLLGRLVQMKVADIPAAATYSEHHELLQGQPLPDDWPVLQKKAGRYFAYLDHFRLSDACFSDRYYFPTLYYLSLYLVPLYLPGYIFNELAALPARLIATHFFANTRFYASVKMIAGMATYALLWGVAAAFAFSQGADRGFVTLTGIPLLSYLSLRLTPMMERTADHIRFVLFGRKHAHLRIKIAKLRRKLLALMQEQAEVVEV